MQLRSAPFLLRASVAVGIRMNGAKIRRMALLILLATGVLWMLSHRGEFDVNVLEARVRDAGAWGPLVFILLCSAATILFVPATLFVLASGVLFGPLFGSLYSLLGATLGAALAFLIARYITSNWVMQMSQGRLKRLIEGVDAEGWHFVAFVRLVPIFPFFLMNYALGLTRIRLLPYVITTCICTSPGVVAFAYTGYVGREALGGGDMLVQKALLALGLLAALGFLPRFIKRLHDQGRL